MMIAESRIGDTPPVPGVEIARIARAVLDEMGVRPMWRAVRPLKMFCEVCFINRALDEKVVKFRSLETERDASEMEPRIRETLRALMGPAE